MIYTVTLNPALDKTVEIPGMALDTVNRVTSMRTDPGGKGINVSKVIAKLGGESCAVGILGGESGRTLLAALEREGLRTHFRFVEGQTRTNLKIIDRALHTNTDINEPGLTVSPADLDALLRDLLGMVREGDIVVLAGSLPQGAPQDTYRVWTAACREKGAWVCLDADGVLLAEEDSLPVTPLFPADACEGAYVFLFIGSQAVQERYRALRDRTAELRRTGQYDLQSRLEAARELGRLLGYTPEATERMIASNLEA